MSTSMVGWKEWRMNVVFGKLVAAGRAVKNYSSSERVVLYPRGKIGVFSHV